MELSAMIRVVGMLAAAAKTAAPVVEHQLPHPADVPETLASISAVGTELGWKPRIFFPDGATSDAKKV
jgi:nucleoside-diphosphate-sugar epimerase